MNLKYYIAGVQVSEEEARKQQATNDRIMAIDDFRQWLEAMNDAAFILAFDDTGSLQPLPF